MKENGMATKETKTRKLRLSKETIRNLEDAELELVFGGSDGGQTTCTGQGPENCCSCGYTSGAQMTP
jgi:hypothetical protein